MLTGAPFFGLGDREMVPYGAPHYEVREGANAAKIEVEVPRYRVEDIHVSSDVDTGIVTVKGKLPAAASGARDVGDFGQLTVSTSPLAGFQRTFRFAPSVYDVAGLSSSVDLGVLTIVVPRRPVVPAPAPVALFGQRDAADQAAATPGEMSKVWSDRFHVMSMRTEQGHDGAPTYHVQLSPAVTKEHVVVELQGRQLIVTVRYHTKTAHAENVVTYTNQALVPAGTRAEDVHTAFVPGHMTITLTPAAPQPAAATAPAPAAATTPAPAK